jgi:hypothetical protein
MVKAPRSQPHVLRSKLQLHGNRNCPCLAMYILSYVSTCMCLDAEIVVSANQTAPFCLASVRFILFLKNALSVSCSSSKYPPTACLCK